MKIKIGILIILLTGSALNECYCQEEKKNKNIELNGYVKDLQSEMFENIDSNWLSNNMIHNRINFKWYIDDRFTFIAEARNRLIWGDFVSMIPDYATTIEADPGFIDLSVNVFSGRNYLLNLTLDRLMFSSTLGKWQFTIGRQRINWGQTFAWNPNDIFNAYSYFDFDYEEKPGSDALRVVYNRNATSQVELAAKTDRNHCTTAAFLYRFNQFKYDFQVLGGLMNDSHFVAGAGITGTLWNGSLRAEATYAHPASDAADTMGNLVASAGYDYIFPNSSMLQFEFLYNGYGSNTDSISLNDYYFNNTGILNLMPSRYAVFGSWLYPVNPLLNVSLSSMFIPISSTIFIMPSVDWSPAENFSISLLVQSFLSNSDSPGGKGTFAFIRLKAAF